MAKYIPLDALVAEIDKWINGWTERLNNTNPSNPSFFEGGIAVGKHILSFLNSLEVKEVDLDGERRKYLTEHFNVYEDGILQSKRSNLPLDTYDVIKIAKHFFELGLNTQHSSINIPNTDDILEESGIDPYSKEAKIFKESYYMALEKLKAQKGE